MTWTRLFLALPLVLLLATTSAAACAWVLWTKEEHALKYEDRYKNFQDETGWKMGKAYDTHAQCDQVKERAWTARVAQFSARPGYEIVKKVPNEDLFITFKNLKGEGRDFVGGEYKFYFSCYPDTIDPRDK